MAKDMTSVRHDRLSRVMAFLQSRVRATHDEIFSAGEYKSNRTLQNDLCYLRGIYGADIRYDIHSRVYIMESAEIFHVNLRITESEITALSAGLDMAGHFLPHLREAARSLWEKLGKYMPAEILLLGSNITRSTLNAIPVAEISASISDDEYMSPEEAGFTEDYTLSAWHVIPGEAKIPVKVRITEPLAETFREVKWHPSQKVEECEEGGVILSAEIPNLYEFARWVMSGAPHVIVIEPEELKEIVRGFAEEILNSL